MDASGESGTSLFPSANSIDASDAEDALPVATFATLPLELKALVVAHVCANDRAHKEYRSRAGKAEAALIKAVETPWHGRGLYAVATVNKELNAICAKHVFQSLTTAQAAAPLLVRRILPKHAKHIRILALDGTLSEAKKAFNFLPLLTNLSEIRINNSTAQKLFGSWPAAEETDGNEDSDEESEDSDDSDVSAHRSEQALRRALFRHGTPTVTKIHFNGTPLPLLKGIMGAMINLRSVSIKWGTAYSGGVESIIDALAGAPLLRELTLDLPKTMSITPEWSSINVARPALTSLALQGVDPSPETFDFIATFAPTLESLELRIIKRPNPPPESSLPLFRQPFPLLNHLSLANFECSAACVFLESLAAPAVTTTSPLRRINLELKQVKTESWDPRPFRAALRRFNINGLRVAELRAVEHGSLRELWYLRELSFPRHTTVSLGVPKDTFFGRSLIEAALVEDDFHAHRVKDRAASLRGALEFGLKQVEKFEAAKDLVGMETAFDSLQKLRVWQKIDGE
ncbi:hypothetical protein RQP46_008017 [Phenoliferia psychrophenolica]